MVSPLSSVKDDANRAEIEALIRRLEFLRAELSVVTPAAQERLDSVHPCCRDSARNLLHYLALRRHDLRELQGRLAALGLSSLGRAEANVLATINTVLHVLYSLAGRASTCPLPSGIDFAMGHRLLSDHTTCLLGPPPRGRNVRIMVTMPREAAEDPRLIHDLLDQGMDCLRINCAHDDAAVWSRMISHLRLAEQALGRSCRLVMDLAGPKLRTGPLAPGPSVLKVRPRRDPFGRVTDPARLWLTAAGGSAAISPDGLPLVPVPEAWLAALRTGEPLTFTDARGARREWLVVEVGDGRCLVEARQTAYLMPGMLLCRRAASGSMGQIEAPIGPLPALEQPIALRQGDLLIVSRDLLPGHPAISSPDRALPLPARIGCTLPEVFDDVKPGESIWFDDGRIGGLIERIEPAEVVVRMTMVPLRGAKLRADKGINLPDSNLRLPALTAKDLDDLRFVAHHADVVQLSFANSPRDVESLRQELQRLGDRQPAIVLKIETRRGFENLPETLLAAMQAPCCGVMIARGDLAVECGFERLAEAQEEILWICEAAHVPVIWATQVLESLAKEGLPSRAEITDAAMGHRSECVMLNKGPYMVRTVGVLADILGRMQTHQAKKQSMLRELHVAHALPEPTSAAPEPPRPCPTPGC